MKATSQIGLVVVSLSLSMCSNNIAQQTYGPDEPVSIQVFYNQLGPFGMWVDFPPYGFVWIPNVPGGFVPYVTAGHWVHTRYGWTWYSYYKWGWAPFHYGRWHYDVIYGWVWVPDTIWGPAWVVWRTGGGYCGWAPLGPNISVNVVISGGHTIHADHWVFVPDHELSRRHVERYRVDRSRNRSIMETAVVTRQVRETHNVTYMPGPDRNEIQRMSSRSINQIEIRERNDPGTERLRKDRLDLFKPQIQKEPQGVRQHAPEKVFGLEEIKRLKSTPQGKQKPGKRSRSDQ